MIHFNVKRHAAKRFVEEMLVEVTERRQHSADWGGKASYKSEAPRLTQLIPLLMRHRQRPIVHAV